MGGRDPDEDTVKKRKGDTYAEKNIDARKYDIRWLERHLGAGA
jgi:hypothetical protein